MHFRKLKKSLLFILPGFYYHNDMSNKVTNFMTANFQYEVSSSVLAKAFNCLVDSVTVILEKAEMDAITGSDYY